MSEFDGKQTADQAAVGLCLGCSHVRAQPTNRGAVFYRCARADTDPRFMRYPPLPLRSCPGFEERDPEHSIVEVEADPEAAS